LPAGLEVSILFSSSALNIGDIEGSKSFPSNALKDSLRNTNPRQSLTDFGTPIDVQSSEEDSVYLTGRENPFTNVTEGGLNEIKANRQSWGVKASTGIARAIVKAGAEVLKMPGVIGGAIAAPFAEEGQGWDTFVNNKWINTIDEYNEKINEDILPVYVKKAIKDGDLMDNLTSIDFWATEGADGAGFIASMFVPGALMKSFNIGSKITEIASMSKKVSQFQKMLGITPAAIDNLAITTANTIFESASEAGSAMKSFEQDLNRKLNSGEIGEEEYNNLLKLQNNSCDICKLPNDKLVVDHCHTTGKIRGLLCTQCNSGLGMFRDNIPNILEAINYLNKNK